jgi:hypothetical protein
VRAEPIQPRFLSIDDLVDNQGELALTIEYDAVDHHASAEACAVLPKDTTRSNLAAAYVSLCDLDLELFDDLFLCDSAAVIPLSPERYPKLGRAPYDSVSNVTPTLAIFAGKKYKPVALKVRPVETELPSCFCIVHKIEGDPLEDMPWLPTLSRS